MNVNLLVCALEMRTDTLPASVPITTHLLPHPIAPYRSEVRVKGICLLSAPVAVVPTFSAWQLSARFALNDCCFNLGLCQVVSLTYNAALRYRNEGIIVTGSLFTT